MSVDAVPSAHPEGGSPSVRRVALALAAAGIPAHVLEVPQSARTAGEAAAAIGCRVEQIAKSLIFRRADDGRPVLVIASGPNRVDVNLVAGHVGAAIVRADASFVRAHTGFAIGGVPPLGHASPIQTVMDQDLLLHETIWASAGTPHAVFSVAPRDLVAATAAQVVAVSAPPA